MEQEDRNVEELEERAEKVERELQDTKRDWEAKQESGSVPGVEPGETLGADEDEEGPAEDEGPGSGEIEEESGE